jgi:hypothetical protein
MLTIVIDKLFATITPQEQERLKIRISRYLQFFVDPSVKQPESLSSDDEKAKMAVDTKVPKINLGFPIIIVGCKADYFQRKGSGIDDKFEYLTKRLRKVCLEYGATLIYSSAVGKGVNVELLQDYILHRVYNFNLGHPAKAVGSTNEEDYNIYIPAGYDTLDLISMGTPANSQWNDKTELESIFEIPSLAKTRNAGQEIEAEENIMFFKKLQFDLEKPTGIGLKQNNGSSQRKSSVNPETATFPLSPQSSPMNRDQITKQLQQPISGLAAVTGSPSSSSMNVSVSGSGTSSSSNNSNININNNSISSNSSSSTGSGPRGAGRGAKHQTAVKAFFKSLLSGGTGVQATSSKENLRADAARALQTMSPKREGEDESLVINVSGTDGQDQTQPNSS